MEPATFWSDYSRRAVEIPSGRFEPRGFAAPANDTPLTIVSPSSPRQARIEALESGGVLLLSDRRFDMEGVRDLLFGDIGNGKAKNISFNPSSGALKGVHLDHGSQIRLSGVMARYCHWAESLVKDMLPDYASRLERGKTSFRQRPCDDVLSDRKDDRRLHIDAFPSQPVQGRRILRVFRNVNPEGEERLWEVGEPFRQHAARFVPNIRPSRPGSATVLQALGVTKGMRTPYDDLMLQLHDDAKADDEYQARGSRRLLRLEAGATWVVFTDATVHAAIKGRYAFEQTFFLPIDAMADPSLSPLRVLESITGRELA